MKKLILSSIFVIALTGSSHAWYDSYGGFTCGYLDPLTSFLDSIFGPPCPPPVMPVAMVEPIAQPVPYPVPTQPPVPRGRPVPLAGPYTQVPMSGGCGALPCGLGGVAGGVVGPGVGYGTGIPGYVYDSGIGMPNPYAPIF